MAPSPASSGGATSVQVALRIRPATKQDSTSIPSRFQRTVIHAVSPQVVSVDPANQAANPNTGGPVSAAASNTPAKKQTFAFDQVHGQDATQFEMFTNTAAPLLDRFLEGFNCTILAYGQTSSGKTYTMTGMDLDADPSDPHNGMGIIPRSISEIFARAAALKDERAGTWTYTLKGSFVELYNEELIDLLSYDDAGGGHREVQIREDKHGHIIWEGLRDVPVRSANEVMSLIRQGTSIRRTNETDMNAQSSRSHAIFSLTLTQRKYSGSGAPPRSSTPNPTNGRSPSRLARPVSHQFNANSAGSPRVSSPTFGRPPTPSFQSAISRGGGLRPSSALGSHSSDGRAKNLDEDSGEWSTIISKFHFVDLAGSERLKRTAAAGERVKEGISINSGLLALGNVISALGDTSRARTNTASHIPYRDSKLTRLLQDSLGGNAHTMMIACVSPAEWNANETVNTLKYANRARNIKNRAVVTEKEEGWDDLEWLQNMVTRLRKDVKSLKDGGAIATNGNADMTEGAGRKVLTQMVELQSNYEDLRAKFVERTEELTRLRRELGERHRSSGSTGTISGTAKYEEIVGPVIEEYEKTISAMEAELSLNRAALRHTNDLVEEKEEELSQLSERHAATEMYVEELKSRVSKLAERESSTEAYIRDLEEKIKTQEDTSISSSESVTDLKREIARFKDGEGRSQQYIAELEARLSRNDESILSLRNQVEKLESESEAKQAEVKVLQARLDGILNDGDSWRSDLEEREKRVRDLEMKMEEWQAKGLEAKADRVRLGEITNEVQAARRSLEIDMASAAKAIKIVHPDSGAEDGNAAENGTEEDRTIAEQLKSLRETHAATLADLSSVTSKYRDALKEISDLAGQINEIKLSPPDSNSGQLQPARADSPERLAPSSPVGSERSAGSGGRRRPGNGLRSREPSDLQVNSAGRQLFFRQAASTESLRARSLSQSQSLSQELFSARSRMPSSPDVSTSTISGAGFGINGSGLGGGANGYLGHPGRHGGGRPNLSISLPIGPGQERSVTSLEKEIMRLQEVLKDREAEITTLEGALREKERPKKQHSDLLTNGYARESQRDSELSPIIMSQINAIRKSMEIRNPAKDLKGDDETLDRLNELMLSMAQKEAQHREEVDELSDELSSVRKQHDELTKLNRDQQLNMSTELDALRSQHSDVVANLDALKQREAELMEERSQLEDKHEETIQQLKSAHEQALKDKQSEVDDLLEQFKASSENTEHGEKLVELHAQLAAAHEGLTRAQDEHENAFGELKASHEEELRKLKEDVERTLADTKAEHAAALEQLTSDHSAAIKEKEDTLHKTEEDFYTALSNLRQDHAANLSKKDTEHSSAVERLKEEHASQLRMAELAREGSLSDSQSQQAELLKQLQDEHASAIEKKEALFTEDLEKMCSEHASVLEKKQADHAASIERLKVKHTARVAELEETKTLEVEALQRTLTSVKESHEEQLTTLAAEKEAALKDAESRHDQVLKEMQEKHDTILTQLNEEAKAAKEHAESAHLEAFTKIQEDHAAVLAELEKSHGNALGKLAGELETSRSLSSDLEASQSQIASSLEEAHATHQQALDMLLKEKIEEMVKLKAEHAQILAESQNVSIAAIEQHQLDLENARLQHEAMLSDERERLSVALAEAEAAFAKERETMRKDHELLLDELNTYKTTADEYVMNQEDSRRAHADAVAEKDGLITKLREDADAASMIRNQYEVELENLRRELQASQAERDKLLSSAAQHAQLVSELDKSRALLTDAQTELKRARETPAREQPPGRMLPQPETYNARRGNMSKLPPLTPPPSVPPPPAPKSIPPIPPVIPIEVSNSLSSQSTNLRSSGSSRDSNPESPVTSVAGGPAPDLKLAQQVEEQAKHVEEQEAMIKTLNKQLSHCESDLQAHMDLVSTLETSLGDSEKNLRKARMQATEIARERDNLSGQVERLRRELDVTRQEMSDVRRSIIEEKQSLEARLDEERNAKERTRQQLEMRVEEIQRRKSKFACL